jgi:uncharacterized membrane protein
MNRVAQISYLSGKITFMSLSYLAILAALSLFIQFLLALYRRPKMHLAIFAIIAVGGGIASVLIHYLIFQELSARPLFKAVITSGMLSCLFQFVFSVARIFRKKGLVDDHGYV